MNKMSKNLKHVGDASPQWGGGGGRISCTSKVFPGPNVIKNITKYLVYKYPTLVDLE